MTNLISAPPFSLTGILVQRLVEISNEEGFCSKTVSRVGSIFGIPLSLFDIAMHASSAALKIIPAVPGTIINLVNNHRVRNGYSIILNEWDPEWSIGGLAINIWQVVKHVAMMILMPIFTVIAGPKPVFDTFYKHESEISQLNKEAKNRMPSLIVELEESPFKPTEKYLLDSHSEAVDPSDLDYSGSISDNKSPIKKILPASAWDFKPKPIAITSSNLNEKQDLSFLPAPSLLDDLKPGPLPIPILEAIPIVKLTENSDDKTDAILQVSPEPPSRATLETEQSETPGYGARFLKLIGLY